MGSTVYEIVNERRIGMKEFRQESHAIPLIEWTDTDSEGNPVTCVICIGKTRSNLGKTLYWLGSGLGDDKGDLYFDTFTEAMEYAKSHIKADFDLLPVEAF